MELKTEDFDYANLQDNHFHTKSPPSPSQVLEAEPPVEENDKVILRTPTSALSKIQSVLTCPPAPRKPKAAPSRKRKGSHTEMRLLDLSNDVLSMYPPALLKDFGNKLKKARRDHQHEQLNENICSNINYTTN
ncbi:unnamed protein product [Rhodiola kirilowii]